MEKRRLKELVEKFRSEKISDAELRLLKEYIDQPESEAALRDLMTEQGQRHDLHSDLAEHRRDQNFSQIWEKIDAVDSVVPLKRKPSWPLAVASCAAILLFAVGFYVLHESGSVFDQQVVHQQQEDLIVPGGPKARLLLDNGRTIDLESLSTDTLIELDGYSIRKNEQGELTYALHAEDQNREGPYNTIITPNGGEYKLNLPDGTTIWVNASSTLRYPLRFAEVKREVELTGEAFFDVSKLTRNDQHVPFFVYTGDQHLEVLGTSFNINSYGEGIETTLVEGKVKLSFPEGINQTLSPNQQTVYIEETKNLSVNPIDPYYVTAWKNGSFAFQDTPIKEVMESLARWYDVDIAYGGPVDHLKFTGTISKYEQIQKILHVIELTDVVKFKTEGRRIVVM